MMDGQLQQAGPAPPEPATVPPSHSAKDELGARFDRLIADTFQAAGDYGIRWNAPEGRFIQALLGGMQMLNATSLRAEHAFATAADAARVVAETELRKVREVGLTIEGAKQQSRAALELARVEHQAELRRIVADTFPGLLEQVRNLAVIREQSWNRDRARANIRAAGLWMLGVFLTGFVLCLWMQWSDSSLGARCRNNLVSVEGRTYCLVSAPQAQAGGSHRQEQGKP